MVNHPYEGIEAILATAPAALQADTTAGLAAFDLNPDRNVAIIVELGRAECMANDAVIAAVKAAAYRIQAVANPAAEAPQPEPPTSATDAEAVAADHPDDLTFDAVIAAVAKERSAACALTEANSRYIRASGKDP